MQIHLIYLSLIVMMIMFAACSTIDAPITMEPALIPVDSTLIERGIEVYRANYCGSCHTLTAANTRGTFGPAHDHVATMAAQHLLLNSYSGEATTIEAYIRESIVNPIIFYTPGYEATNHHMPAFTHLPDDELELLVYLLAHQHE